jgi:hypothetical protein
MIPAGTAGTLRGCLAMFLNVGLKARQIVASKFVFSLLGNDLPAAGRPTFAVPAAGPEPPSAFVVVYP